MIILDPGHQFQLTFLDGDPQWIGADVLTFVKRVGENYPGNRQAHAGTTMQEVLRALIARVKYVDHQLPCSQNELVLYHLRSAIYYLEVRAAVRHHRDPQLLGFGKIEMQPTCPKCLHIGCDGSCHP